MVFKDFLLGGEGIIAFWGVEKFFKFGIVKISAVEKSPKYDSNKFKPQQTAAKFSANIISATVYLFVESPCL